MFTVLVALALGLWQYDFYSYQATNIGQMDLSTLDRGVVYWTLCARTCLLLVPAVLLGVVATWRRRFGFALVTTVSLALGSSVWLLVEMEVHRTYGRTLSSFAGYLVQRHAWELGGGVGVHLAEFTTIVLCAVVLISGCLVVTRGVIEWLADRVAVDSRRVWIAVSVLWVFVTLGPLAARGMMSQPAAFAVLNDAQPASLLFFVGDSFAPQPFADLNAEELFADSLDRLQKSVTHPPLPADVLIPLREDLPNIVMIVVESLRHDAVKGNMPRLESRLDDAMVCGHHYANSNRTETGLFALLYGRPVVEYEATLSRGGPPHLCRYLRESGYRCSFVSSHDLAYGGMDRFIRPPSFDEVHVNKHGWWYERDRKSLADAAEILVREDASPNFVVVFLMSTHYSYAYPAEYRHFVPDAEWTNSRVDLLNRYRNALRFTDDAIHGLLSGLDRSKNVVIVTGDHGESFYEDGTLTHACRLSEITCRVPWVMYGGGIAPRRITSMTQHTDVLPTLLHVLSSDSVQVTGFNGSDLLGCGKPRQQVMVAQPLQNFRGAWEQLLIRPEGRLGFQVGTEPGFSRLLGFYDESGLADPNRTRSADHARQWRDVLRRELPPSPHHPNAE